MCEIRLDIGAERTCSDDPPDRCRSCLAAETSLAAIAADGSHELVAVVCCGAHADGFAAAVAFEAELSLERPADGLDDLAERGQESLAGAQRCRPPLWTPTR